MDGRVNVLFHSFAILSVILTSLSLVTGDLVVVPENRVAAVGQSVQFDCSTNDNIGVNWLHIPLGSRTPKDVYIIIRTVVSPYHPRFTVHAIQRIIEKRSLSNSITAYNLLITNISMEDAGTYRCVDRAGMGEQRDAELTVLVSQVMGDLVVAPENRVAAVGQSVQFDCSTDDTLSVNWLHFPLGSRTPKDVYISRTVISPYSPRFTVQREELANNVTAYNLLLTDIRVEDAGTYSCVGRTGMGEKRDAELIILGSLPNCNTNIGPNGFICENDCRHPIDEIRTLCSIEYAGNIAPLMQWKTTSGQDTIQPQPITKVSAKTVSSELNITAMKSMDGASVIWYSTQSTQMKWTSAPVKTLYAKQNLSSLTLSQSQVITCSANSSQHCSYTWIVKMDSGESQTIERQTLEVNQPGTYLCHAHCPLHQRPCTVIAMHVEYRNGDELTKNLSWVAYLVIGILALVILIILAIFILNRRKKRHWTSASNQYSNGNRLSSVPLAHQI